MRVVLHINEPFSVNQRTPSPEKRIKRTTITKNKCPLYTMRVVVHINKPLSVKWELKVSEKVKVQPALEVLTFALDLQTCRQV